MRTGIFSAYQNGWQSMRTFYIEVARDGARRTPVTIMNIEAEDCANVLCITLNFSSVSMSDTKHGFMGLEKGRSGGRRDLIDFP